MKQYSIEHFPILRETILSKFKTINLIPEFEKDFKKLLKRFITLESDLVNFINTELYLYHKLHKDNDGIRPLPDIYLNNIKYFISKKFACRAIAGKGVNSEISIVYQYTREEDKLKLIEIFYKGDKEIEDRDRLTLY
jgi:hypothetical protein